MLFFELEILKGASAFRCIGLRSSNVPGVEKSFAGFHRVPVDGRVTDKLRALYPRRPEDKDVGQDQRISATLTLPCEHAIRMGMVRAMADEATSRELTLDQVDEIDRLAAVLLRYDNLPRETVWPLLNQAYLAGKQFGWALVDAERGERDKIAA